MTGAVSQYLLAELEMDLKGCRSDKIEFPILQVINHLYSIHLPVFRRERISAQFPEFAESTNRWVIILRIQINREVHPKQEKQEKSFLTFKRIRHDIQRKISFSASNI
jgi:hypothetical protein